MGIEKISGQAGYQSQAVQAAQTSKVNVQPSSETNNSAGFSKQHSTYSSSYADKFFTEGWYGWR